MPGSSARKERRRKERELSHAQLTSKVAYAESVADDGETGDNAAHTASNAQSDPDGGISPRVSSHDLPQETQRSPQRLEQSLLLSSGGKGALIRGKAYQKQSKSRSRRGAPPRVPRESEPPLGTVPQCPPSMYEEAMRALQGMTATDTAILRHTVMNEMAASGFSGNSRLDDAHRAKGPHKGSSTSSSRLTAKHDEGDIMTKREVENLRRAFMATISGTTDQNISDAPLTSKSKNSKSADSSVLPFGVNLDGAAHSVEIVQPNEDIPDGEEACIVQANESDEDEDIVSKLQGRKRTDLGPTSSLLTAAHPLDEADPGLSLNDKVADKSLAGERTAEASIAPNSKIMAEETSHVGHVAHIDNVAEKLRRSFEKVRSDIASAQESTTPNGGAPHHSSSSDYASSSGEGMSKPYVRQTRRITNDGILELKASPSKVDTAKFPLKDYRRKVSLKLPVNVSIPQRSNARRLKEHTLTVSNSTDEGVLMPYETEERELEYKHRHTFIGTASLDDFLEILEVSPAYMTMKRNVVQAFGILACAEQVQARQSSISSDGWDFVTRITHDDILTHTDYITESRIKLGSISLGKFLGKVPFDDKGVVAAGEVVEAFCLSSHLDGEATYGSQSKAKAFRRWMVRENVGK